MLYNRPDLALTPRGVPEAGDVTLSLVSLVDRPVCTAVSNLVVVGRPAAVAVLVLPLPSEYGLCSCSIDVLPGSTLTTERTGKTRSVRSCWLLPWPSWRSEDVLHDDSVPLGAPEEYEKLLSLVVDVPGSICDVVVVVLSFRESPTGALVAAGIAVAVVPSGVAPASESASEPASAS